MHQGAYHQPVMTDRVVEGLAVRPGGAYIDCTLGDAGHATAILEAAAPSGRLLGIDADPEATAAARDRLAPYGAAVTVVDGNFRALESLAAAHGFVPADGVLFDLGISSRQLDAEERGFSFRRPGPLDMRFTPGEGPSAADLVNTLGESELADLIYRFGEEPRSRRIARAIVAARPIDDAMKLADVVRRGSGYPRGRTHPATRTFQALRIAVNDEMASLEAGLEQAPLVLGPGGRLVVIAYHSLEDRRVKRFMNAGPMRPLSKKVTKPSADEIEANRRSRSARLRVAERPEDQP
ncbi:MAG: 16S rRNA (cytosine(1402)-N(4))-methyltransferase RsmH [Chloroflexi bacterium]|nr:16S rRNA (cytosine(1402)-N(4))-methyltransferase RsmH [Chloroflexota bacterium]